MEMDRKGLGLGRFGAAVHGGEGGEEEGEVVGGGGGSRQLRSCRQVRRT